MRPTTGPYGSGGDMHETAAEELARTERGLATHSGVALSWLSELSGDEELISEVTTTRFLMLGTRGLCSQTRGGGLLLFCSSSSRFAPELRHSLSARPHPRARRSCDSVHPSASLLRPVRPSGCFCAASFGSALGWLSYAPIANLAEQHFDVGPGWMNFASNLFLVLYIPGSVVSLWATEVRRRRRTERAPSHIWKLHQVRTVPAEAPLTWAQCARAGVWPQDDDRLRRVAFIPDVPHQVDRRPHGGSAHGIWRDSRWAGGWRLWAAAPAERRCAPEHGLVRAQAFHLAQPACCARDLPPLRSQDRRQQQLQRWASLHFHSCAHFCDLLHPLP